MRAHIPMTIAVLPAMSLFILFSLSSGAASLYTDDGDISARLELERWYINRARFAPEMEADRLGLINTTSGGHPNYDVCEDTLGSNDFGTTVAQWTPWTGSRPPLAPNRLLSAACEKHSRDMAESQRFTHYSPSGKYYPLDSPPWERATLEGYDWSTYGENIGAGYSSPANLHAALFVDSSISNRGHRVNILSRTAREIGLGYAETNTYYQRYDTQDFASPWSEYFFTDTLFCDANSNSVYNEGEGVNGVEIRLWDGTNQATWYDSSTASGNFAIPISDLPVNQKIAIQLINTNTATRRVSIPWGFNTLGDIDLTNHESMIVGTYFQPHGLTNVGFRNLIPTISSEISWLDTNAVITFNTFMRTGYRIETCVDGTFTNWITQTNFIATSEQAVFFDPASVSRTACLYRIVLIRE